MSNCNNCFNGCTETISDQCIKYTGIDIPNLGIKTGDSLSFVEQVLLTSLLSTLDGRGISIDLSNINICNLVQNYLPAQPPSEGFTLNDILSALIQASCSTQTQLISNYNSINALINTQSTTFADANGAMASLITNISATMDADRNHTAALITTETLARVTANTAMASSITNLSATVNTDRANTAALIRTEALTRADAISSMASLITNISASVTTNTENINALISSSSDVTIDPNGTLVQQINAIKATMLNDEDKTYLEGLVNNESTARIQGNTTIVESINGVRAAYLADNAEIYDAIRDAQFAVGVTQAEVDIAVQNAIASNGLFADIANDNKLTPIEKNQIKKEWDIITSEKPKNDEQAILFGPSIVDGVTINELSQTLTFKTTYGNVYNTLSTYVNTTLSLNTSTTDTIVGATLKSKFKDYYDARTDLLNAIVKEAKRRADYALEHSKMVESYANATANAVATIDGKMQASYVIRAGVNGDDATISLLSEPVGTTNTTSIKFNADVIKFTTSNFAIWDGTTKYIPFQIIDNKVVMTGTTVVDTIVTPGTGPAIGVTGWNGLSLNKSSDNLLQFRHPNGVVGMEMGIISGKLVLNWYNDQGELIWKGGSDGVTAIDPSAASYAGQITNVGSITVYQDDSYGYQGDILSINYEPPTGTISSAALYAGAPGLNGMFTVEVKNPCPNDRYKINVSYTDSFISAINPGTRVTPNAFRMFSYYNDNPGFYLYTGLGADVSHSRNFYFEVQTIRYNNNFDSTGDTFVSNLANQTPVTTNYQIGQAVLGGIVGYILQPYDLGYNPNVQHGLIVAPSDQGTAIWGCEGTTTGATKTGVLTGKENTNNIYNACNVSGIAARLCQDLVLNGYNDWWLPSRQELNNIWQNRAIIGGFNELAYWSSTECSSSTAYYHSFINNNSGCLSKGNNNLLGVRAVRFF